MELRFCLLNKFPRLERSLALAIRNLMLTLAVLTYWADVCWANVLDPAQKLQPTCGSLQQARKAPVQGQTILPLYYCSKQEGASPILMEKEAKQLLRSRRQDRPSKPGFPDEPMREYMHHLLRLEHRAEEQFLEHWLNPHCKPHCDRNVVHPV
ncbi:uncharacterized protein C17orf67 homolog isoform X1 [Panthera pardus]|uniref:Uncharacterized protein C17orf67 homolog isoform X1 n=1 Tax=Panthera pardus TaxID=9691 RepID=A0A9V1E003_PANPR|nr:uncharacterized protein C17orf67 homolog isoform X1 [Panthera pardus]XP_053748296.1 uncharacterized protein C17orf67 homolog isoform X1 [Panthera pardus]